MSLVIYFPASQRTTPVCALGKLQMPPKPLLVLDVVYSTQIYFNTLFKYEQFHNTGILVKERVMVDVTGGGA